MSQREVVIIDYGMGNLWSVASAVTYLGYSPIVSSDLSMIASAKKLILPGVGSFRRAMHSIKEAKIDQSIFSALEKSDTKLLGICLGMQLLGSSSVEDGLTPGLGLVTNAVQKLASSTEQPLKIPHVGFARLKYHDELLLLNQVPQDASFYFVHSFAMQTETGPNRIATATYGGEFVAIIESGQVFGTQFHPEKSQKSGLKIIENFLGL